MAVIVYLLNRSPLSANPSNEIPFGQFNTALNSQITKPDISNLYIFSYKAICYIPKEQQVKGNKFGPAAEIGYFVGYTRASNIYSIWFLSKRQIKECRDIIFNKNIYYKKQQKQEEWILIRDLNTLFPNTLYHSVSAPLGGSRDS